MFETSCTYRPSYNEHGNVSSVKRLFYRNKVKSVFCSNNVLWEPKLNFIYIVFKLKNCACTFS